MNNKMNGILAASIATLVAAGGIMATTAEANAASAGTEQTMSIDHARLNSKVSAAISKSNGADFVVRRPFELSDHDRADVQTFRANTQRVALIQSAIHKNHALLKSLARQNVDARTIVDVQPAANGTLVFYQS